MLSIYYVVKSVVDGDRSCTWPDSSGYLVTVWDRHQCGVESKIVLFRPLGLSLAKVPNLQSQIYSYCLSQRSLFGSCCGAWVRIWNVTLLSGCCFSTHCVAIGLLLSDRCSSILNLSGLVV